MLFEKEKEKTQTSPKEKPNPTANPSRSAPFPLTRPSTPLPTSARVQRLAQLSRFGPAGRPSPREARPRQRTRLPPLSYDVTPLVSPVDRPTSASPPTSRPVLAPPSRSILTRARNHAVQQLDQFSPREPSSPRSSLVSKSAARTSKIPGSSL